MSTGTVCSGVSQATPELTSGTWVDWDIGQLDQLLQHTDGERAGPTIDGV